MKVEICAALLLPLLLAASQVLQAGEEFTDAPDFAECVAGLQARARDAGISEPVVRDVLGTVSRVERVIELDREQPEFTRTFADYYNNRVTDERVLYIGTAGGARDHR